MTKETRDRISESILKASKMKHPNVPDHVRLIETVAEGSANQLTKTVIEFLKAEGCQAERINTMGVPRLGADMMNLSGGIQTKGGVTWTKGGGTTGSADISASIKPLRLKFAVSVKIEIKYGKDRQSESQKVYQANVEQAGGIYFIVRNLDDFLIEYDNIIHS